MRSHGRADRSATRAVRNVIVRPGREGQAPMTLLCRFAALIALAGVLSEVVRIVVAVRWSD
jgi:hypothetical protein